MRNPAPTLQRQLQLPDTTIPRRVELRQSSLAQSSVRVETVTHLEVLYRIDKRPYVYIRLWRYYRIRREVP